MFVGRITGILFLGIFFSVIFSAVSFQVAAPAQGLECNPNTFPKPTCVTLQGGSQGIKSCQNGKVTIQKCSGNCLQIDPNFGGGAYCDDECMPCNAGDWYCVDDATLMVCQTCVKDGAKMQWWRVSCTPPYECNGGDCVPPPKTPVI